MIVAESNHAVDHFLSLLIESKSVVKSKVLRIGGFSKCELLDECNLNQIKKANPVLAFQKNAVLVTFIKN